METLANFWWIKLPRFVRRVAITPAVALTDGLYIAALPTAAAFLSPLIFILGLLFGTFHIGYQISFSESLPLLLIVTFLGILSGHQGLMFLIGFALGDYFFSNPKWLYEGNLFLNFLYRFARIIQYGVLAMVLVQTPLLTKLLIAQFREVMRLGNVASVAFAFLGHILLSVCFVYFWAQAVPVLIRPLYTWFGRQPTVDAAIILQEGFLPLLIIAGAASVLRMTLQTIVVFSDTFDKRVGAMEDAINQDDKQPFLERVPAFIPALFGAVWGALLLSGLYSDFFDAIIVGIVLLFLQCFRRGIISLPLGGWARLMERIPLIFRLAVMIGILYGLGYFVLPKFWGSSGNSFRPMLFITVFALVVFYFLNPKSSAVNDTEKQQTV